MSEKKVIKYEIIARPVEEFSSYRHAADVDQIDKRVIYSMCKGKTAPIDNYLYRFEDEPIFPIISSDLLHPSAARPVTGYDPETLERVCEYPSINMASRFIGNISASNIKDVCDGKRKTAGGFIWRYSEDPAPEKYEFNAVYTMFTPVRKLDPNTGELVAEYPSLTKAVNACPGTTVCKLFDACTRVRRLYKGFAWEFGEAKEAPEKDVFKR